MSNKTKNETSNSKKKIIALGVVLILLLVLLIGGSYAFLSIKKGSDKSNIIKSGDISMKLDETLSEGINIPKAYPMTDNEGQSQSTIYEFSISNDGDTDNTYEIYLVNTEISQGKTRISDGIIKYRLQKLGSYDRIDYISNLSPVSDDTEKRVLDSGTLKKGETKTYIMQVWMDHAATISVQGHVFGKELNIKATQIVK